MLVTSLGALSHTVANFENPNSIDIKTTEEILEFILTAGIIFIYLSFIILPLFGTSFGMALSGIRITPANNPNQYRGFMPFLQYFLRYFIYIVEAIFGIILLVDLLVNLGSKRFFFESLSGTRVTYKSDLKMGVQNKSKKNKKSKPKKKKPKDKIDRDSYD